MSRIPDLAALSRLKSWQSFFPRGNDTMVNPSWDTASRRIVILRLSAFDDVAESATHLFLYALLRQHLPNAWLDLAFMPPKSDQISLEKHGTPWPLGIQSLRGLGEFDVVLVSLSYILESVNLIPALRAAGIPLRADERGAGQPLIIAGGSSILLAQGISELVDAMFFGEAEARGAELATALSIPAPREGTWRATLAASIPAGLPLWWPGRSATEAARVPAASYRNPVGDWPVPDGPGADTVRLPISLGCPFRCSFCFEGYERKPYRDLDAGSLVEHAVRLRRQTGAKSFDVISFNFNTHTAIEGLIAALSGIYPHVHLMSQRLDILHRHPALLDAELLAGKRSFTLGIEGISPRLRRFYQKDLDESAIDGIIARLLAKGVRDIKLFYIISGYENPDDLASMAAFLERTAQRCRAVGSCRILCSFGMLVRMPFTPLALDPLEPDAASLASIGEALQKLVEGAGMEFRLAFNATDQRIATWLMSAPASDAAAFLALLDQEGVQFGKQLSLQASRLPTPPLPHLAAAKPPLAFARDAAYFVQLAQRYTLASAALDSTSHADSGAESTASRPARNATALAELEQHIGAKRTARPVHLLFDLPRDLALASPAWLESWAFRKLAAMPGPEGFDPFRDCLEFHLEQWPADCKPGPWYGKARFRLQVKAAALPFVQRHPGLCLTDDSAAATLDLAWTLGASPLQCDRVIQAVFKAAHVACTVSGSLSLRDYTIAARNLAKSAVIRARLQARADGGSRLELSCRQRFDWPALGKALQAICPGELVAAEVCRASER